MKIRLIERKKEGGEDKRVETVVKWKVNKNRRRGIPKSYGKYKGQFVCYFISNIPSPYLDQQINSSILEVIFVIAE